MEQNRCRLQLTKKIERSNEALAKLHSSWNPTGQSADKELLTEEERMIFRKIGLKMDEHVLLGITFCIYTEFLFHMCSYASASDQERYLPVADPKSYFALFPSQEDVVSLTV